MGDRPVAGSTLDTAALGPSPRPLGICGRTLAIAAEDLGPPGHSILEVRNTEGTTMKRNALRFLSVLLAGPCLLLAAKVTVDYNHNIDFSQ